MSQPSIKIQNNIISVLVRLDHEAREAKNHPNSAKEIGRRGLAITSLLRKVENEFGSNVMLKLHKDASSKVGHTIGPLDESLVKDMVHMGCSVKKVHGVVQYEKK